MTLDEFMALKEGDQIQGMNGNVGAVAQTGDMQRNRVVHVQWAPNTLPFAYSSAQTAWMHWTKIEPDCKAVGRCLGSNPDDCFELSKCAKTSGDVSTQSSMAQVAVHDSDCAMFNAPAFPASPCDCSANKSVQSEDDANSERTG